MCQVVLTMNNNPYVNNNPWVIWTPANTMVNLQILREIWMTHLPVVMNKRYSKYIQHILIKKFCATNMSLLPYSNNIQILLSGARLEDSAGIHESYQKWQ